MVPKLILVLTFIVIPVLTFFCVRSLSTSLSKKHSVFLSFILAGISPLLTSRLFTLMLWFFPEREKISYFIVFVIIQLAPIAATLIYKVLIRNSYDLLEDIIDLNAFFSNGYRSSEKWLVNFALIFLIGIVSVGTFQTIMMPPTGNDTLEYLQSARFLLEKRNLEYYPVRDAEESGGFYGPWTHPPGYVGLIAWTGFYTSGKLDFNGFKLVSIFFTISLLLGVALFSICMLELSLFPSILASSVLIATPVFYYQFAISHIDSIRIFADFATLSVVLFLIRSPRPIFAVLLGIVAGGTLYSHSLGVLLGMPIALSVLFLAKYSIKTKVKLLFTAGLISLLFVSLDLYKNILSSGNIISDLNQISVANIPHIKFFETLSIERGFFTTTDSIFYGVFRGFSDRFSFGASYWFALLGFLFFLSSFRREKQRQNFVIEYSAMGVFVLSFYLLVILSLALGSQELVKNPRYFLSIQPIIACFGGYGLSVFLNKMWGAFYAKA